MAENSAPRPRLLITGASGYLGRRLVEVALPTADVVGTSRSGDGVNEGADARALDITDSAAVRALFEECEPTAVINAAAVNPGSGDELEMRRVNAAGAGNVAASASLARSRMVHVSTDIVHAGTDAPYADDAASSPVNAYGRTKAVGEEAVLRGLSSAAIVRTSLIYGLDKIDRGTAGFVERLQAGETVELFRDVVRQPVWIDALAGSLVHLALDRPDVAGTLNVAGDELLTRSEFGRLMLDYWGIAPADGEAALPIHEIDAADVSDEIPRDLRLDLSRATELGLPTPGVTRVLKAAGFAVDPTL